MNKVAMTKRSKLCDSLDDAKNVIRWVWEANQNGYPEAGVDRDDMIDAMDAIEAAIKVLATKDDIKRLKKKREEQEFYELERLACGYG